MLLYFYLNFYVNNDILGFREFSLGEWGMAKTKTEVFLVEPRGKAFPLIFTVLKLILSAAKKSKQNKENVDKIQVQFQSTDDSNFLECF